MIVIEPPLYFAQDHLFDLNFHPQQDLLVCAQVTGRVNLLKYNSDDVVELAHFEHHTQSVRVSQFFPDGMHLLTASKDMSFAVLDCNGTLLHQKHEAHKSAINVAKLVDNNIMITGDDSGHLKIWDLRQMQCVYRVHDVEEAISGIEVDATKNFLLSSSLDGFLCVHDLRVASTSKTATYARSDCMEEDLTDLCLVKEGKFVCTSTSEGNLLLFKWDHFGDFKDRVVGHPNSIDTILKVDENSLITGGEDGLIRGVGMFPNGILGVLGQHEEDQFFPITKVAMDRTKKIAASLSHDNSIKFYDVADFVIKRANAEVWTNDNQFVFSDKPVKPEQIEDEDEDDDDEDDEDSDEIPKQKKKRGNKTQNVKQSISTLKKQKFKQFFDKL